MKRDKHHINVLFLKVSKSGFLVNDKANRKLPLKLFGDGDGNKLVFLLITFVDYSLPSLQQTQAQLMAYAGNCLNDHVKINVSRGDQSMHLFSTQDALARHRLARKWLKQELSQPFAGAYLALSNVDELAFGSRAGRANNNSCTPIRIIK